MFLLNSEIHCGLKLTIHNIYISKILLWSNLIGVAIYSVSHDSLMCFLVYGELMT